jgi:intracellular multiplication protein IcmX
MKTPYQRQMARLLCLFILFLCGAVRADTTDTPMLDNTEDIKTYLYNWGLYTGYDISGNTSPTPPNPAKNTLLSDPATQNTLAKYVMFGLYAALPVQLFSTSSSGKAAIASVFVPSSSLYKTLNDWANYTFPSYSTPDGTAPSVSSLIDQESYQIDPVNQALLNLLATPDSTYCKSYDGTTWTPASGKDCTLLYGNQVVANAMGTLPGPDAYYSYDYQAHFLNELNANSLIAPLEYSTEENDNKSDEEIGLVGKNQVEYAANYVRYVSGLIQPIPTIKRSEYDSLLSKAYQSPAGSTETDAERTAREDALASLNSYIAKTRIYAARNSVAISNLYALLAKRLVQKDLGNTSQAVKEMQMATWRQYDPSKPEEEQWIQKINTASPATLLKEIALELSDINQQLYLNRQQDERILLTNTLLLLTNLTNFPPGTSTETE